MRRHTFDDIIPVLHLQVHFFTLLSFFRIVELKQPYIHLVLLTGSPQFHKRISKIHVAAMHVTAEVYFLLPHAVATYHHAIILGLLRINNSL